MAQSHTPQDAAVQPDTYSLMEVAKHLDISPEMLRTWNRRFAALLGSSVAADAPRYGGSDIAVLRTVQLLLDEGYSDAEVQQSLTPRRIEPERPPASLPTHAALVNAERVQDETDESPATHALALPSALGDVLGAIAGSQQTVLNSQASMREMVSVVVQDNFNLKDENRKLRDRMLELERGLAEYQRREETRKERLEARMRALEGTVSALQQQMSQFVQMQRAAQTKRRGWW
jgi:DNA-binding transcriptional MerR regulator